MKSRALIISRSGTPAKSIKPPTKAPTAATANNPRRNQTPDAAETAVLAAVGAKPEEFSDTLASCDSSTGHRNRSNRIQESAREQAFTAMSSALSVISLCAGHNALRSRKDGAVPIGN